jgi:hypothetical protein
MEKLSYQKQFQIIGASSPLEDLLHFIVSIPLETVYS